MLLINIICIIIKTIKLNNPSNKTEMKVLSEVIINPPNAVQTHFYVLLKLNKSSPHWAGF